MNNDILTSLRPALVMTLLFAILLGLGYPLAMTGIGQLLFPDQANGSLVTENGRTIGSRVVGQAFTSDRYFHTRPSAAGKGYDGLASSGSNLGPTSQALADRVNADVAALRAETTAPTTPLQQTAPRQHAATPMPTATPIPTATPGRSVPPDLVTSSASGLDPHISPEAALFQVDRVARVRAIEPEALRRLVGKSVERPLLGFLGEPRVNVFELNRRLDAIGARQAP